MLITVEKSRLGDGRVHAKRCTCGRCCPAFYRELGWLGSSPVEAVEEMVGCFVESRQNLGESEHPRRKSEYARSAQAQQHPISCRSSDSKKTSC